jgi:DNA-binding SARP family transcriptional activator
MRTIGRRLLLVGFIALLLITVWLLAESRPPWPTRSALTATAGTERLLVFIAWLGGLLLAIGLLCRIAVRDRDDTPSQVPAIRHLHRQRDRRRVVAARGYPDRALPLIPRSPSLLRQGQLPEHDLRDEVVALESETSAAKKTERHEARIEVLGPLTITGTRKRGRGLRGPTRELLVYLALHPHGAHRDQIIDALWPEQAPEQGRNRLWRAAADARHHLGDTTLTRENEHYRLDRTQVTVDLDELENFVAELGDRADEGALPLLEQALGLFGGEPLAGSDLPWGENEQRRLHAVQLDLLERAGAAHLAAGDPTRALAYAERGLVQEPYNEKVVRVAMRAEAALGLRTAIVARYEHLCQLLDAQLGLQPQRETKVLYRSLLGQDARISA